jgi:hypothetical protein
MAEIPRAVEPRSAEARQKAREYWDKMDTLFYRTIGHAERAFKINVNINIVVVIVGIVLLAYSIVYSWINGLDVYSTAFGSLGVIDFIAIFYLTPQRKIQKTVGDLAQIQMFYRTYYMQAEAVNDWDYYNQEKTIEQLVKMNKHMEELTHNATEKIEELVGKKE